jgi:hypothetical protein
MKDTHIMSNNITSEVTRVQQLLAGTSKHFSNTSSLAFASASFTPQALTQLLQSFVNAESGVTTARSAYRAKLAARNGLATSVMPVVSAYEAFVKATFSKSPDVLADFGLAPKKVTKPSVLTKAVAVDKRRATREARHTMGKKQKQSIRGNVPASAAAASPIEAGSVEGAMSSSPRSPSPGK